MAQPAYDLETVPVTAMEPQAAEIFNIGRVPHISMHAYCHSRSVTDVVQAAASDRRLARARCTVNAGTIAEAVIAYQKTATPDLLLLEAGDEAHERIVGELTSLAAVCDATTKVVVIGRSNDIVLYRKLLDLGVAEYLLAPLEPAHVIALVSRLYQRQGEAKLGRACAFIGATGGAGSSVMAQNVAWTMADGAETDVMLADLDLPFGSTELSFNLEPVRGLIEAVEGADRLDEMLLERMLVKRGEHLRLLPGGAALREISALPSESFERLLDVAQSLFSSVLLDVPHAWSPAVREILLAADEVVITAQPDLAGLRNTQKLVDFLKTARPNDRPPKLVLNQVRLPKRSEIHPKEFVEALGLEATAILRFDPAAFSAAATKGQMLAEHARKAAACGEFRKIAEALTGRCAPRRRGLFGFPQWKA